MKTRRLSGASALAATVALAACNAGGGEDEPSGVAISGVITTEIPTDAERASFPDPVNDVIDAFVAANALPPAPELPGGTAVFAGTSAFGISTFDGDLLATLSGDATLEVDFDNLTVNATFDNFAGTDIADGGSVAISDTSEVIMSNGAITGTSFAGGVAGNINATINTSGGSETIDFEVGASLDGAFAGDGATTALGEVDGIATSGGVDDEFSGFFVATQ